MRNGQRAKACWEAERRECRPPRHGRPAMAALRRKTWTAALYRRAERPPRPAMAGRLWRRFAGKPGRRPFADEHVRARDAATRPLFDRVSIRRRAGKIPAMGAGPVGMFVAAAWQDDARPVWRFPAFAHRTVGAVVAAGL